APRRSPRSAGAARPPARCARRWTRSATPSPRGARRRSGSRRRSARGRAERTRSRRRAPAAPRVRSVGRDRNDLPALERVEHDADAAVAGIELRGAGEELLRALRLPGLVRGAARRDERFDAVGVERERLLVGGERRLDAAGVLLDASDAEPGLGARLQLEAAPVFGERALGVARLVLER